MRTLLLLAVAVPLAVAAPVPKEFKAKRAEYLPLAVGYKREYVSPDDPDTVTEVREVTAVEEKGGSRHFTVQITNGGTMVMRTDKDKPGVVSLSGQNGRAIDPPYQLVAPDLKEGDKWEYNDPVPKTRTVGKAETITVPAGTFTALPVTIRYLRPGGGADVVSWYADGVGMVRQDTAGRPTLLLKAATGGKDAK